MHCADPADASFCPVASVTRINYAYGLRNWYLPPHGVFKFPKNSPSSSSSAPFGRGVCSLRLKGIDSSGHIYDRPEVEQPRDQGHEIPVKE
ncbi:hypothetical protein SKAU_G00417170 [Synaphobranchus kaupii]|uniref:Uncharacterized protein n=1 Tax=Synaphobranchus kaupii TaxID=118154 RepID=A0A9Q1IAS1_SYNKA|nr:hypothetical protein SKAU_G00417170 [Synaphobranchus kaupii]